MSQLNWVLPLAAINGFIAVALGAFGAHGLKKILSPAMLDVWQTAVHYHFVHTLALLAVGILAQTVMKNTALVVAACGFTAGILIFSGSLYALSLSGIRILGAITPLGGVAFLLGWASLALATLKH